MLRESGLARVAVVRHRALREILALMGPHHDATGSKGRGHQRSDKQDRAHRAATITSGADPLYIGAMRSSWFLPAVLLVACGGPAEGPKTPDGAGSGSGAGSAKTANGADDSIDIPPVDIKGVYLEPRAMDGLGVPAAPLKKGATLDSEKKAYGLAKDSVTKQAHAVNAASELFRQYLKAEGDAKKQLLTDARQLLADAVATAGAKADETALELLGRYDLLLDDNAAAEKVWSQLVALVPATDKASPANHAWWALSLLKQGKNADALGAIKDQPVDKSPLLAYVAAWAMWRTGDGAGAWKAISQAAAGWDQMDGSADRDAVKGDLIVLATRTPTSMEAAIAGIQPYFGKQPTDQYELLRKLAQGYRFAGRWADGLAADAKSLDAKTPPNDRVSILFDQASLTLPLDAPTDVAKFSKAAIEALPACGAACTKADAQNVILATFNLSARFHSIYATANDRRYYDAAHDMYAEVTPKIDDVTKRNTAADYSNKLELTMAHAKVGTGRHDKNDTAAVIDFHAQEIQACYEDALAKNGKLTGDVTLMIDLDQTGAVKGVTTDPKAGSADLAAVAGCVADRAKGWKLPARGSQGTTRVKTPYHLTLRK
jgi:hypothetical protein